MAWPKANFQSSSKFIFFLCCALTATLLKANKSVNEKIIFLIELYEKERQRLITVIKPYLQKQEYGLAKEYQDKLNSINEFIGQLKIITFEEENRFIDELKPRDEVARSIYERIEKNQKVYLDLRHLGIDKIKELMPQERRLALDYSNIKIEEQLKTPLRLMSRT